MEENDANLVRFRLVFDDRHLLGKSLRSQGLRRCWFLLKPGITTIRGLASHIRKSFGLHDRIVLFMDDFVLPSFESTSIITDKDIITVRKKEVKQKDICKTCDGQNLIKDPQIATVHDSPPFSNDLLPDDKSQKNSHGSSSSDKEKLFSCTETEINVDPPSDVVSSKRKRRDSKKLLGSNCQPEENNHVHQFEPGCSSDVRKIDAHIKQASAQMLHHSSDGEEGIAPVDVQAADIHNQSQVLDADHNTQDLDATQRPLFVGSSSMNAPNKNEENLPQTTKNDRCFKIDEMPPRDGLLPLPMIRPRQPVYFESLLPLRRVPVKGDILVYRYAEQSSSACPTLSSHQVGKVSSFDYKSLKITLHPVLDYDILFEGKANRATMQHASHIKEDELIEIDFTLLVDVRLLKTLDSEKAACQNDSGGKDTWEEALAKGKENEINVVPTEQSNGWSQWVSNTGPTVQSWSCKQPNAPFAGRGRGRTNWASNRGMNSSNRGARGRNFNRNSANWNPSRYPANGNTQTLPWSHRTPGFPAPWDTIQNGDFPPGDRYDVSGNQ